LLQQFSFISLAKFRFSVVVFSFGFSYFQKQIILGTEKYKNVYYFPSAENVYLKSFFTLSFADSIFRSFPRFFSAFVLIVQHMINGLNYVSKARKKN